MDTLSPDKQKKRKGGRGERSSSPVSRGASHASGTDTHPDASEVTKPSAKRAKRAAGIGTARVVTRPVRKGTCLNHHVVKCWSEHLLCVLT